MSKVGAEIELFLKKEMEELSKENKKDRHEQNNKIQNIVTLQEQKIEKILYKVEKMYAKKWVEKAWWGIIVMVFSALWTAIMTLVLK